MSKLLTPRDIHTKMFHTHRFAEGYDIEEVNEFLEEVENTVAALAARLMTLEGGGNGTGRNDTRDGSCD